jgi:hypothetical protein
VIGGCCVKLISVLMVPIVSFEYGVKLERGMLGKVLYVVERKVVCLCNYE